MTDKPDDRDSSAQSTASVSGAVKPDQPGKTSEHANTQYDAVKLPNAQDLVSDDFRVEVNQREQDRVAAWDETARIIKNYSNEVVDQWNRGIDALLTFAGLFSAILTAFNVQSYQLLQPPVDMAAHHTAAILLHMSSQLSSFSLNNAFINSTATAFHNVLTDAPHTFRAPLYAIVLNILWFSALVLGLSGATLGIIAKQWLKEFGAIFYESSRETARRRQYRLNKLKKWQVSKVVSAIPVLLVFATVFFLIGLLILLWSLHRTVTVVVAVLTGFLLLFLAFTSVAPTVIEDCCYFSPQALSVFLFWEALKAFCFQTILVSYTIYQEPPSFDFPASFERFTCFSRARRCGDSNTSVNGAHSTYDAQAKNTTGDSNVLFGHTASSNGNAPASDPTAGTTNTPPGTNITGTNASSTVDAAGGNTSPGAVAPGSSGTAPGKGDAESENRSKALSELSLPYPEGPSIQMFILAFKYPPNAHQDGYFRL